MSLSKQTFYVVRCDECGAMSTPALKKKDAAIAAVAKNGFTTGDKQYCPRCKQEAELTDKEKDERAIKRAKRQVEIFTEKLNPQPGARTNSERP